MIGSGFIGCEIAASLRRRSVAVTLISDERTPNEARLGAQAGAEIARWLREEGVRLELGTAVGRDRAYTATGCEVTAGSTRRRRESDCDGGGCRATQ